jgi:hypothetical protein
MLTTHGYFEILTDPHAGETLWRIEAVHIDGAHLVYGWKFWTEAMALKFAQRMENLLLTQAAKGYATRGAAI